MLPRSRLAVGFATLLVSGCVCGVLDPAARFACRATSDCGPDFLCVQGECVAATSADASVDGGPGRDAGLDAGSDAGADGGLDADGDGFPVGVDCDDQNPAVNPNATEVCSNSVDDDCDSRTDCAQPSCAGLPCGGGGTCVSAVCVAPTEVRCDDGLDNDGDGRVDCLDSDCGVGASCNDGNACSVASACAADGGCEATQAVVCNQPPTSCFLGVGTCAPDAGVCAYTPRTGSCEDGLACTLNDTCASGACVGGPPRVCTPPANTCLGPGTCQEPSGMCFYRPLVGMSCTDGNPCTVNDQCDGDGGCGGTPVVCTPPTQCHQANGCGPTGMCTFSPRTGQACDAGTGIAGACTAGFLCVAPLFPFTPSNFTEAQLPSVPSAPPPFAVTCDATLTLANNPSVSSTCGVVLPPFTTVTPPGGVPTTLFLMSNLNVTATLTIVGTRPVIFAVTGDATISGRIRARNAGPCVGGTGGDGTSTLSGSGSGGGGFGSAGAPGGGTSGGGIGGTPGGMPTLIPLLSGCRGGTVSTGGAGGGAVQVTTSGLLSVSGVITASGLGGQSLPFESAGGGGSGGAILLEGNALILATTSWLTANGGGGAEGFSLNTGAGARGADGSETSNLPAAGGSGMGAGGNGGNGASALGAATAGLAPSGSSASGGGGGGGAGRIRLNAAAGCLVNNTWSPRPTSNGSMGCP